MQDPSEHNSEAVEEALQSITLPQLAVSHFAHIEAVLNKEEEEEPP